MLEIQEAVEQSKKETMRVMAQVINLNMTKKEIENLIIEENIPEDFVEFGLISAEAKEEYLALKKADEEWKLTTSKVKKASIQEYMEADRKFPLEDVHNMIDKYKQEKNSDTQKEEKNGNKEIN